MPKFSNIAAYKFVPLTNLKSLRARLLAQCKEWRLKGTILLSTEGINLFVAGSREEVERLLAELRSLPGLDEFEVKFSESDHQPFNRMLVRIKKEIIAFGVEGVDPARRTSAKIAPSELKQWLDEGRSVTLLDTRNDYEVKLGTFRNALPIGVDHFRDFPGAVEKLPEELKEQPIVMFCTGGIRCEKAGPFMEMRGFKKVLQLEGGILKYFEECGGAHYDGECFVFDQRVGVDPALQETDAALCFRCLAPLTKRDQDDRRYVPGESCPHCFTTPEQRQAVTLAQRNETIQRATNPLPGSRPYDNYRPVSVPAECDGGTLLDALCRVIPHIPREEWAADCERGLVVNRDLVSMPESHFVKTGERYARKHPNIVEPDVNAAIRILHEDEALIVLDKPAPLPMHAGGRFNRNTLQYILNRVYHPEKPRPAHRIDANTTGVVVMTRTRRFASRLQPQFASGGVEKVYLARVQGWPDEDEFCCDAPISAEPGDVGTREVDGVNGLSACTEFRVIERFPDETTLLEVRPLTGRTNQIRVHLQHLGLPVCGDPVYLADGKIGAVQTLSVNDPPLCLHSWRISFRHPLDGARVSYCAESPFWAALGAT